jgi:ABC-type oligopeptide transport system ATPase subunit
MADSINTGAQGAVSTLKGAQNVGKQLGSVVSDQQSDMEKAVQQQHVQRLQARAQKEYMQSMAEFRAFQKYEKNKVHEKEVENIKKQAISKYGKNAWTEIEALKNKMEKERSEEAKLMDVDRQKQIQLFWWCATAAALVTYFFKLYK